MKKLVAAAAAILFPAFMFAQGCLPVREVSGDNLPFKAGENFRFVVHYKWGAINADVGKAYLRLDTLTLNGSKAYSCQAYGRSAHFYDIFFKVREDFRSCFSMEDLRPLKFSRETAEGGYTATNSYKYNWTPGHEHIAANIYTSKRGHYSEVLPLDRCTFDLPSLFYYARNLDIGSLVPGKRYPMTFAIDEDIYNISFEYIGREVRKIKGIGNVRTLKFGVSVVAGEVFTGDSDLFLWISDDDNRIPLLFEAPIIVGNVSGRLEAYDGLKYPFSALAN